MLFLSVLAIVICWISISQGELAVKLAGYLSVARPPCDPTVKLVVRVLRPIVRWPIGAIHEHKTKYTNTKSNTRTQNQIHEHKTKYTNTKPNTRTQNQIHEHKTKYTNTKPNTRTY